MKTVFKLAASTLALSFAAGMANADDAFWKEAAAPYEGVTLRGVTESSPPSLYIREVLAPQFEELTGIRVDIETTSWDQMFDQGDQRYGSRNRHLRHGLYRARHRLLVPGP